MSGEHPYRETIPPIPGDTARPMWSVMIPTYNRTEFLHEALTSVLVQDPGPEQMQIEVVDNCSDRGDIEAMVRDIGQGRIQFCRKSHNVGPIGNFNACLKRARGRLVHVLHDDDAVRPGFYRKLEAAFVEHPEIGAAFCRQIFMDKDGHWHRITPLEQQESGVLDNWLHRIIVEQRIQFVAMVVRRDVYEALGGFDRRCLGCNDWERWIQIAARYPVWYEVEPLALFRFHAASVGRQQAHSGEDYRDFCQMLDRVRVELADHLPRETADRLFGEARDSVARSALWTAGRIVEVGDLRSAMHLVREALRASRSRRIIRSTVELLVWIAEYQIQIARGRQVPVSLPGYAGNQVRRGAQRRDAVGA